ncbi:DUF5808 domain-containing protein [Arthrobacter sp. 2MCAF15]|uniref:DUF5808 domain-containing protein n=1 Tax=Arthrobacter sp. 2MCAF15 TaxID=3232984 RepID=UPI003F8DCA26
MTRRDPRRERPDARAVPGRQTRRQPVALSNPSRWCRAGGRDRWETLGRALLVPRRFAIGWTLNLGSPGAAMLVADIFALIFLVTIVR